jgi:splicing suppressor protein 51
MLQLFENMEASADIAPSCVICHKNENDLLQPLRRCSKCQTAQYCSRWCQKGDWKQHKRVCTSTASSRQGTTSPFGQHNPGFHAVNELFGFAYNTYLHKLSEKEAMVQLVDCFRMRVEDECNFAGILRGCYGERGPLLESIEFLDLAEK